jgi:succinyl-CoA synthetase alpha subunit
MTILLSQETRAIVQGITGKVGQAQTHWMLRAGTPLVAGVTPGRGGQQVEGLPVYDTVVEAVEKEGANASVMFVPALLARDAAFEALDAGLRLVVIVTEHIPLRDTMEIKARARRGAQVIGPNCPGIFVPGLGKLGIMPANIFRHGSIGVVGRSATLSYEVIGNLTDAGLGQTAAVGIGGDPVVCTGFADVLKLFEADEGTRAVVLVGEIGGSAEEQAAGYITTMSKPVVALIAGRAVPPGRRFGHAGAIIRAGSGGAEQKIRVLREAGASIADTPAQIPALLREQVFGWPGGILSG